LFAFLVTRANPRAVPAPENIHLQQELDKAVTALDAELFEAYNRCDWTTFALFFADDVEFYH